MFTFTSFRDLREFIEQVKPLGSFSAIVAPFDFPSRHVTWTKGKQCRDLDGRFMTWAHTGGLVHWSEEI